MCVCVRACVCVCVCVCVCECVYVLKDREETQFDHEKVVCRAGLVDTLVQRL